MARHGARVGSDITILGVRGPAECRTEAFAIAMDDCDAVFATWDPHQPLLGGR